MPRTPAGKLPPPADTQHRAVHQIRLSAIAHNYSEVESAAHRQRCEVICVTKADGYGHGAVATALFLADQGLCSAWAVATLEEAKILRKAFQETAGEAASSGLRLHKANVASLFQQGGDDSATLSTLPTASMFSTATGRRRSRRQPPSHIRILVLGPPVGYPRCFDDYFHFNIELMVSGPEIANQLKNWVMDPAERRRTQVERSATEAKEMALKGHPPPAPRSMPMSNSNSNSTVEQRDSNISDASTSENSQSSENNATPRYHPPSATLGNVTGSDLAKELREILKNQQLHPDTAPFVEPKPPGHWRISSGTITPQTLESSGATPVSSEVDLPSKMPTNAVPFAGIEEAARKSRILQKAAASEVFFDRGDDDEDDVGAGDMLQLPSSALSTNTADERPMVPTNRNKKALPLKGIQGKRLRYHIAVDSGMGRLGFRTEPLTKGEQGKRRDTVEIIKELVDLETKLDCPIELFGMITHMAEANATSTYTNAQISKFKDLLNRVRAAGVSVPTISTDNSAALLTETLTHFDPKELLTQEFADTRGFVRIGGAIYGQRPSFPQLRAVSTLMASVRHVAILRKGDSVGYDRAYVADHNVRIATLTIGFADGYPRELGNKNGQVAIRGHVFPVVGNVCMDMLMVELGDASDKNGPGAQVVVGDTAILWGPGDDEEGDGLIALKDLAERLKTTQSALTCGLDKDRVLRQYA